LFHNLHNTGHVAHYDWYYESQQSEKCVYYFKSYFMGDLFWGFEIPGHRDFQQTFYTYTEWFTEHAHHHFFPLIINLFKFWFLEFLKEAYTLKDRVFSYRYLYLDVSHGLVGVWRYKLFMFNCYKYMPFLKMLMYILICRNSN